MEAVKVIGGVGPQLAPPVKGNPSLDPNQGLVGASSGEQLPEGQTVLGHEPGLPSERDVSRDVPLCEVDRAQNVAPTLVVVAGLLSHAGGLKARSNLLLEGGQPRFVERRCGVLLDLIAECV